MKVRGNQSRRFLKWESMRMAPDVRLAQPKSAMNLFSLDTCCLTRKVIFLVATRVSTTPPPTLLK